MSRTPNDVHEQFAALARDRGLPDLPERPEHSMCCGRGCEPCIWDYYENALVRWREHHGVD